VENLLTVFALNGAERNAEADRTDKRVNETSVLLLDILLAQALRLLQHVLDKVLVDALDKILRLDLLIVLELWHTEALV